MKKALALAVVAAVLVPAGLWSAADEPDLAVVAKIRQIGIKQSRVMELATYLSDVIGARPTGSPAIQRAYAWSMAHLKEWGLANVAAEPYEDFGVGWSVKRVSAHLLEPHHAPLIAISVEWGSSTTGVIRGAPLHVALASRADFEKYRGRLKGRIVFYHPPRPTPAGFTADARRHDAESLAELARYPIPDDAPPSADYVRGFADDLEEFFRAEGVGVLVSPSAGSRRDYGTVQVTGIRQARHPSRPRPLPEVILAAEHYNRVVRILEDHKAPALMEVEVQTEFYDKDLRGFNVVAEIPGTDLKDEVVMLGGHIDSWSPGTGAADNAAGVAVSMEAVRILQAMGVRPRRTIRIALWSAEEKGWLGSRAYVARHFADVETMTLKPAHGKVSAYFNFDNGSGRIRGIYTQQNVRVVPIFRAWMEPFHDLGMTQISTRSTMGSDHGALDLVGIPAFQWIQDPLDYGTRVHHTNMDVSDHLVAEDLVQASVITASFVYHTAMRDERLPRKPLPAPSKYPIRR